MNLCTKNRINYTALPNIRYFCQQNDILTNFITSNRQKDEKEFIVDAVLHGSMESFSCRTDG